MTTTKIEEDNYIYHCVNLPVTHEVQISSHEHVVDGGVTEQNIGEMINLLSPIINVEEGKLGETHHHLSFNQAVIKGETYIIHHQDHPTIKLEIDEECYHKLNGSVGCSSDSGSPDTEIKRHERLQKDIFRKKMARLRESDDQRVERLKKDRVRKKRARQNESLEQRQRRLEKDRVRIQKRRSVETDDERQRRLEKNRISKRKARLKENALLKDILM